MSAPSSSSSDVHADAGLELARRSSSSSETIARADRRRAALGDRPAVARARPCRARRRSPRTSAPRTAGSACAATPAEQRPRLRPCEAPRQQPRPAAPSRAPKRASSSGCSGTRSIGRRKSAVMSPKRSASGPNSDRHARAVVAEAGRRLARPSGSAAAPRPPSSGCAYWTSGQRHVSPCAPRSKRRENGVSTRERVGRRALVVDQARAASARCCACRRRACRRPRARCTSRPSAASVRAAASPLGPLPTTTARGHAVHRRCCRDLRRAWLTRS